MFHKQIKPIADTYVISFSINTFYKY